MPVSSATGSITDSQTNFGDIINTSKTQIEGIVSGVSFSQAFVDFAGMDVNNIESFKTAIDTYRGEVHAVIDDFNPDADMESALKGQVADAVRTFLAEAKELLKKYVQAIDLEKKEIDLAAKNYTAAEGSISGSIGGDADTIRGAASGINLE